MGLFSKPHPGTGAIAAKLLVALMIPSAIVTALGGTDAGMAFGISAGFVMAVAPMTSVRTAVYSAFLAGVLAAVSSLAGDAALPVAALMLASAVLLALTNQISAGLLTLAPIIVVVYGPGPVDLVWWQAFAWTVVGGLAGVVITRYLGFVAPKNPIPSAVAWRHAIVLGVLSAGAMYWALASNISHGYWVAVTLLLALRPVPDQRHDTLRERLLGTALGAVIALAAVVVLPTWAAAIVAAVCLVLLVMYAMGGSYFMQTLFLTPMLLLFGTLGDAVKGVEFTLERVWFTLVGTAIGFLAAWLLDILDRRDEPVSEEQTADA